MKRVLDILMSAMGLVVLAIPLAVIAVVVKFDSHGPVLYRQVRLGRGGRPFSLYKFRTMHVGADRSGRLTVRADPRVTRSGEFLRHYKLDEFPQLFNVLVGQMSLVGPRPEVPEYGYVYPEQEEVRSVRPGITDPASLKFRNESELLDAASDPEALYRDVLLKEKTEINLAYVREHSVVGDIGLILSTLHRVFVSSGDADPPPDSDSASGGG
jgi:lipopolysaccharide/colanic/teichoic acid biosynthesis glycosyltransferase